MDVEAIAKGLTEAQRNLLFRIGDAHPGLLHIETNGDAKTLDELLRMSLVAHIRAVYIFAELQPLGETVLNFLKGQQ